MEVFGNIILENDNLSFENLKKIIERPFIKPRYRLSVLNPDETIDYIISNEYIQETSVSFTENYQNGQRKNISLSIINNNNQFKLSINDIWLNTKFRFDIGIEYLEKKILWFPKGIYILGNVEQTISNSEKILNLQLLDKFAIFEGKTGTLETAYEVELGSNIEDAIKGILNFTMGNGYILDYKEPIFDPSFFNQKTQTTIRAEAGDNLGTIIDSLATQLSAEYYYNNLGNLCFYPINETVDDSVKPIIWTYNSLGRDLHSLSLSYQMEEVTNCVKVVGDNIETDICSAIAVNENITSPLCVQRIGKRMSSPYSDSNVWSDDLAQDLANYYLRKASILAINFSAPVSFNPILTVNNLCEIENKELSLKREKLLITSISFSSNSGEMNINFCNTSDLPNLTKGD